jgi:gentisate 1,2-dioxygenase
VVPSWTYHEHQGAAESVLFSYSDAAVLKAFGLFREEPLAENDGHQQVTGKFEPLPVPERAPPTQSRKRRV